MKTIELEKNLHLIGYYLHGNEAVIDELLDPENDFIKNYVQPFNKELNLNLLSKDTFEGKNDLIKFYIFEFWELQEFYKSKSEVLFTGGLYNYEPLKFKHILSKGDERILSKFENYTVHSFEIFDLLLNKIQLCCIKYKIDFFRICNELNFSIEIFDSSTTSFVDLLDNNYEARTDQERPNFKNNFDKVAPEEVYKHFKAGLVDKKYLTSHELNQYLRDAFELKTPREKLYRINDAPNKKTIEAVFYLYYKGIASKIHGRQNQYAALLGDYFEGFKTSTICSNFSKSIY